MYLYDYWIRNKIKIIIRKLKRNFFNKDYNIHIKINKNNWWIYSYKGSKINNSAVYEGRVTPLLTYKYNALNTQITMPD